MTLKEKIANWLYYRSVLIDWTFRFRLKVPNPIWYWADRVRTARLEGRDRKQEVHYAPPHEC